MDDILRRSAADVIVEDHALTEDCSPELDPDDLHHLDRVLRLRPGQVVTVTDGAGRWRPYRWRGANADLEPDGPAVTVDRPAPPITIGFTPVKGDRPEWTVAKLTELGVDTIVPLQTERSVVRWAGDRAADQVGRLRRVAREAAMQSRRCRVPRILEVSSPVGVDAALAHFGGEPVSLETPAVLIGPEGGWSDAELEGRDTVDLGPHVLRAETAALTAGVLLTSLRHATILTLRGRRQ